MHSNYHPIILVPTISEFFEKVLDAGFTHWLDKGNIISETQGECCKGH